MQMAKIWKILDIKDGNIIPFGVILFIYFFTIENKGRNR